MKKRARRRSSGIEEELRPPGTSRFAATSRTSRTSIRSRARSRSGRVCKAEIDAINQPLQRRTGPPVRRGHGAKRRSLQERIEAQMGSALQSDLFFESAGELIAREGRSGRATNCCKPVQEAAKARLSEIQDEIEDAPPERARPARCAGGRAHQRRRRRDSGYPVAARPPACAAARSCTAKRATNCSRWTNCSSWASRATAN